jgi:ankyrin repeat protein
MLLEQGADANKRDSSGWSPLHDACFSHTKQSLDIIRTLVSIGNAQPTALTDEGASPLHLMIQNLFQGEEGEALPFLRAMDLMIEKGANVNSQNNSGETPLHLACSLGHSPIVHALLERHADLGQRNRYDAIR